MNPYTDLISALTISSLNMTVLKSMNVALIALAMLAPRASIASASIATFIDLRTVMLSELRVKADIRSVYGRIDCG